MNIENLRSINEILIFKKNEKAGKIIRTKTGSTFIYEEDYFKKLQSKKRESISFAIKGTQKEISTSGINLHPFFAGLLPEGLRLTALVSSLKTSADDLFSLFLASGKDVIGDVFAASENSIGTDDYFSKKSKNGAEIDKINFFELFEKSISSKDYKSRLIDPSIPGIQAKISAQMISFPVGLKNKSYILKLETKAYPCIVKNEHFFMEMAKACGIRAAKTFIVYDKDKNPGLLVERFDRQFNKDSKNLEHLHQEDACQFLSKYPQDKYRLSLREIAEGIEEFSTSPIIENSRLIELKAFSYIIGNGDLHAKNISLISEPMTNRVILSPAYDLLSTIPYGDQTMALHFEGKKTNLRTKDFIAFGKRCGIREEVTKRILNKISKTVGQNIDKINHIGLEEKKVKFLKESVSKRVKEFLN